jgi:ketosteroid isomerase-like protein
MERSNVQLVREAFEAFGRGDTEAALEFCDPEIVVRDPARTGDTMLGLEALRAFWDEWLENWQEYRVEPQEFIESRGEVVVHTRQTGVGRLSGIEISQDLFQVFRVRDGKIVEYRLYGARAAALESLGTDQ